MSMEGDMKGWWCGRHGDALAWVDALSAPQSRSRQRLGAPVDGCGRRSATYAKEGCATGRRWIWH